MTRGASSPELFTVVIVTILRNDALRRSIRAWREQSETIPILVVDQNGTTENETFFAEMNVDALFLPFNSGLSESRNKALSAVRTEFIFLCDDDQVPLVDIGSIETVLLEAKRQGIAFTGAAVTMGHGSRNAHDLQYVYSLETTSRAVVLQQVFPTALVGSSKSNVDLVPADVVANAGLVNVQTLLALDCRWDENIRIGHEHIDFFLRAKQVGLRVAYSPNLHVGELVEGRRPAGYRKLRMDIVPAKQYVFQKWNLSHIVRFETSSGSVHVTPLDTQYEWPSLLTKVASSLDCVGCKWWVSNGTLLGLRREGGFIPHDLDLDVTAATSVVKMFRLNKNLRRQNLRVLHYRGNLRVGFEWTVAPVGRAVSSRCDIMFARGKRGHYVQARFAGTVVGQYRYEVGAVCYEASPISQRPLPIPVDADTVLASEYGPQWAVPKSDWNWLNSPLNSLPSRRHVGMGQAFWAIAFRVAVLPLSLRQALTHAMARLFNAFRLLGQRSVIAKNLVRVFDRNSRLREAFARFAGL